MYAGIPIIGVVGGVGSGKSHVARVFADLGCEVIDADAQAAEAYRLPAVRDAVRNAWGDGAFLPDGRLDRRFVAARVFADPGERRRLEAIVHPVVARLRDERMAAAAARPPAGRPAAFVWDVPLLFEVNLAGRCDAVVFVDAPRDVRLRRVRDTRGWDEAELTRRENSQWPLDKKRAGSQYVVTNAAQPAAPARDSATPDLVEREIEQAREGLRDQVRHTLSRVLRDARGGTTPGPAAGT